MAITNKLKTLLDQPVWEWTRFNVTPGQTSAMTAPVNNGRYLYNINGATFTRFDTFTDTLQALQSLPITPAGLVDITYKGYDGYYSRAISGTTTTINGSFIAGKICKGKKIRILEGVNDGEERTITDVSQPVTVDYVVSTSVSVNSPTSITDNTKSWQPNQWRGYQYRIISGNAKGLIKTIVYNNSNTIFFGDASYLGIDPRSVSFNFKATPSAANDTTKSIGVIEYQTATVDTPFTSPSNDTTKYIVLGGAIWLTTASGTAPFYQFYSYDVLSDQWNVKSAYSTFYLAQMGGTATPANTVSLERIGEYAGSYLSGASTSSTLRTLTDTSLNIVPNRFANYQLRLNNGQTRVIQSHTSDTFTFYRDMDFVSLSGTSFNVYADNDKIFMSGGGAGMLAQYSIQRDAWTQGEIHDSGIVQNISIKRGYEPALAITSINYTASAGAFGNPSNTGFATVTTAINHWFKAGDVISISGVTPADYNVSNISMFNTSGSVTSLVYPLTSAPSDTAISNTDAANVTLVTATVIPDASKNWIVNEHRGKILWSSNNSGSTTSLARFIHSNSSTALSTQSFGTAPAIGSRYHIQDLKSFGGDSVIGTNSYVFTANTTAGSSTLTNVTNISAIKLNTPILSPSNSLPIYTRVIGIEPENNIIRINQNATSTTTLTLTGDERLTNGWNIISNICCFRNGDISIPITSITHAAGTATVTTTIPHNYVAGDLVCVRGVQTTGNDNNYNVTYTPLTVTGPSIFTYSMSAPTNNTATAAATTTLAQLVDASRNWPPNLLAGARGRIVAGTGAGQEFTVNTSSPTILTFTSNIATALDSTSIYVIYPNQPRGIGHALRYIGNNSNADTKGKYLVSVRGGNTSNVEKFNITTSEWEFIDPQPFSITNDTLGPGSSVEYDGKDRLYIQQNVNHRFRYIDIDEEEVVPYGQAPNPSTPATINNGNKCEIVTSEDGLQYLYFQKNDSGEMYRTLIFV